MQRPGGTLSMPAVIVWDRQRGPGGSAWQWWSWMKTSHCACVLVPVSLRLQRSYECWSGVNAFRAKWWVKSVLRANCERMLHREKTPRATLLTAQWSTHTHARMKNIVRDSSCTFCVLLLLLFKPDTFHIWHPLTCCLLQGVSAQGCRDILCSSISSANASGTCLIIEFVLSEVWHFFTGEGRANPRAACRCSVLTWLFCVLTVL